MPPVTRDLSIAVGPDDDQETLGDRVRDALGAGTSCVEEVKVLSATACQQLPASAISKSRSVIGTRHAEAHTPAVRRGERSVTAPASMRAELVSLRVITGRLAGVRLRLGTPR